MFKSILPIFICLSLMILKGCVKDEPLSQPIPKTPDKPKDTATIRLAKIDFNITHLAGNQTIGFGSVFQNDAGERMTVNTLSYYLSNFKLIYSSGDTIAIPENYHLVDIERIGGTNFTLEQLKGGNVIAIQFLIGVDSARNTSGAQTGDLDPRLGMFWTWQSGYIMAKMEGKYTTGAGTPYKDYSYHCGGFAAPYSSIRRIQMPLSINLDTITKNIVTLKGDVLEWFKTPNILRIDSVPSVGDAGPMSNKIADNYRDMFTIQSVTQVPYQ